MRRPDGGVLMCAAMTAVFGVMVALAWGYGAAARTLPLVIGLPAIALCLLQLGLELRRARQGRDRDETPAGPGRLAREARLFGWLFGFLAAVVAFGFPYGGPLAVAAFLRGHAREDWIVALGGAAAAAAVLIGLFEGALGLALFRGFFTGWLVD